MTEETHEHGLVAIVIPAYNEEASLANVLQGAVQHGHPVVVSDGSTDNTATIARDHGVTLVEHRTNKGYEQALVTGINTAIDMQFRYIITLDADGQHDPGIVDEVVSRFADGADLVLGIRSHVPRISEHIFRLFGSLLWSIKDPLCGLKAYRVEFLKAEIDELITYESIGSEIAIRSAIRGANISHIPVPVRERDDVSRFGAGLGTEIRILKSLIRGVLLTLRLRLKKDRR